MNRKLLALAASLLLLGISAAHAQFRYGPMVGADITSLSFKQDLVDVTNSTGFLAGVQTEMMFPGIGFGIDFGLLYYQAGAKVNLGQKPIWGVPGFGNERVYLHNLQIPLHLRFKWTRMMGLEDYVAPFVYGGPDFNILLAHNKIERQGQDAFKYAGGDVGLTAGFGLELLHRYQVSAGYTWGMTYSLKTRLLDNFSARTRGWQIRVAYLF